jgi:hypothetical protein
MLTIFTFIPTAVLVNVRNSNSKSLHNKLLINKYLKRKRR